MNKQAWIFIALVNLLAATYALTSKPTKTMNFMDRPCVKMSEKSKAAFCEGSSRIYDPNNLGQYLPEELKMLRCQCPHWFEDSIEREPQWLADPEGEIL